MPIRNTVLYYPEFLRTLKASFQTSYDEKFNYIKNAARLKSKTRGV